MAAAFGGSGTRNFVDLSAVIVRAGLPAAISILQEEKESVVRDVTRGPGQVSCDVWGDLVDHEHRIIDSEATSVVWSEAPASRSPGLGAAMVPPQGGGDGMRFPSRRALWAFNAWNLFASVRAPAGAAATSATSTVRRVGGSRRLPGSRAAGRGVGCLRWWLRGRRVRRRGRSVGACCGAARSRAPATATAAGWRAGRGRRAVVRGGPRP